jgi:hypothetical protein
MTPHFAVQRIVAATLLASAGLAHAAYVEVATGTDVYNGMIIPPMPATFSLSADVLGALDTGKVAVTGYGAATAMVRKDSDGFYLEASATAPVTSLTLDNATNNVVAAHSSGGLTLTAPVLKSVSSGGSLTVTDLSVDLASKKVFATLIGGNGVGTLTNFYLWDIASITGATSLTGPGTYATTLSGLSITTDGFSKFTQSLGLLNLGKSALQGVTDFGVITTAVPEPTAFELMGVGLVGLMLAQRRKKSPR